MEERKGTALWQHLQGGEFGAENGGLGILGCRVQGTEGWRCRRNRFSEGSVLDAEVNHYRAQRLFDISVFSTVLATCVLFIPPFCFPLFPLFGFFGLFVVGCLLGTWLFLLTHSCTTPSTGVCPSLHLTLYDHASSTVVSRPPLHVQPRIYASTTQPK